MVHTGGVERNVALRNVLCERSHCQKWYLVVDCTLPCVTRCYAGAEVVSVNEGATAKNFQCEHFGGFVADGRSPASRLQAAVRRSGSGRRTDAELGAGQCCLKLGDLVSTSFISNDGGISCLESCALTSLLAQNEC